MLSCNLYQTPSKRILFLIVAILLERKWCAKILVRSCRNILVEINDDYNFNEEGANDDIFDGYYEDERYWLDRCLGSSI